MCLSAINIYFNIQATIVKMYDYDSIISDCIRKNVTITQLIENLMILKKYYYSFFSISWDSTTALLSTSSPLRLSMNLPNLL